MNADVDPLIFFLSLVIIIFGGFLIKKMNEGDAFKQRLKDLTRHQSILTGQHEKEIKRAYKRELPQSGNVWVQALKQIQFRSADEQKKIKALFNRAGWRSDRALVYFMMAKLLAIFPPAIGGYIYVHYFTTWTTLIQLGVVIGAALIGSYAVDKFVSHAISARQERIQRAFPDALDMMVICTEAGLSLNATMQRVAREVGQVAPDLGYELALTSIELNMLPDRKLALQNFSDRLDIPSFRGIISTLIQSEQYGTPIAQTMRIIAEEFRSERLLKVEEKAGRLPVLLTLPLAVFILPCIFIVILGPAALSIMKAFK